MDNSKYNPGIIENDSRSALKVFYIFILISAVFYTAFLGISFNEFSETELVIQSHFLVPAYAFAIVGLQSGRDKKSFIYAAISAAVALVALVAFFDTIWSSL